MSRKKSRKAAAPRQQHRASKNTVKPALREATKPNSSAVVDTLSRIGSMPRRSIIKSAVIIGGALTLGAGIHIFDTQQQRRHDLSVIGGGAPVVVQVHDPSCPSCRQLMRSTEAALEALPQIKYRVADLTSSVGREMAAKYGAEKVTLLLFDGRGSHLGTIKGVQSAQDLRGVFEQQFSLQPLAVDA